MGSILLYTTRKIPTVTNTATFNSGMDFGHKESLATKFKVDDVLMDVDGEVFVHGEEEDWDEIVP